MGSENSVTEKPQLQAAAPAQRSAESNLSRPAMGPRGTQAYAAAESRTSEVVFPAQPDGPSAMPPRSFSEVQVRGRIQPIPSAPRPLEDISKLIAFLGCNAERMFAQLEVLGMNADTGNDKYLRGYKHPESALALLKKFLILKRSTLTSRQLVTLFREGPQGSEEALIAYEDIVKKLLSNSVFLNLILYSIEFKISLSEEVIVGIWRHGDSQVVDALLRNVTVANKISKQTIQDLIRTYPQRSRKLLSYPLIKQWFSFAQLDKLLPPDPKIEDPVSTNKDLSGATSPSKIEAPPITKSLLVDDQDADPTIPARKKVTKTSFEPSLKHLRNKANREALTSDAISGLCMNGLPGTAAGLFRYPDVVRKVDNVWDLIKGPLDVRLAVIRTPDLRDRLPWHVIMRIALLEADTTEVDI